MKSQSSPQQIKPKVIPFQNYLSAWAHAKTLGISKPKIKNAGYNNWLLVLPKH
jgi:hypothetical protein